MRFRVALSEDTFDLIRLFQRSGSQNLQDPVFMDYRKLQSLIGDELDYWIVAEVDGVVSALVALKIDPGQRMAKIYKMLVDESASSPEVLLRETLRYVIYDLNRHGDNFDVLYTTTLTLSLAQQKITIDEGFKILGIFPNALGQDSSKMNGLSAYFYPNVLEEKRICDIAIHPHIAPFYDISRKQLQLAALEQRGPFQRPEDQIKWDSQLELIQAEEFVKQRFINLKGKQGQIIDFYPFHFPNLLITSADQSIEIFINFEKNRRFAAVIGEQLSICVDPIELYNKVQQLLKAHGATYIEIINDAGDIYGVDCILKSGFTPCAYFPAFKKLGDSRRDYVVFGKSFEYLCRPSTFFTGAYTEFYKEYYKFEVKQYFPNDYGEFNVH